MRTPVLAALSLLVLGASCATPAADADSSTIAGSLAHSWSELSRDTSKHFFGVDPDDPYRGRSGLGSFFRNAGSDLGRLLFNTGGADSRRFITERDYGTPGVGISFMEWAFNYDTEDPLID